MKYLKNNQKQKKKKRIDNIRVDLKHLSYKLSSEYKDIKTKLYNIEKKN